MLETPDISWFDLRKYDGLSELDLISWHRQIHTRAVLMGYADDKLIIKSLKAWTDAIKTSPIIDYRCLDEYKFLEDTLITRPRSQVSVYDTTMFEHLLANSDKPSYGDISDGSVLKDKFGKIKVRKKPLDNLIANSCDVMNETARKKKHITVNLSAPDEQVISDFKAWLSEQRSVTELKPAKKNITNNNMRDWIKDRLLPYIDLVIINAVDGLGLTQVAIANLVHSDNVNVDAVDRTRRTTKPKALKLFTYDIVEQLGIQISCMAVKD